MASVLLPLIRNWYVTEVIHSMIFWIHLSSNPIFLITFSKNGHSTRSYALLMSSFTAAYPSFPLLLFFDTYLSRYMRLSHAGKNIIIDQENER
jgi:hypothetical protein